MCSALLLPHNPLVILMQIWVISLLIALLPGQEDCQQPKALLHDQLPFVSRRGFYEAAHRIMRIIRLTRLMHFDHLHVIELLAQRIPISKSSSMRSNLLVAPSMPGHGKFMTRHFALLIMQLVALLVPTNLYRPKSAFGLVWR